MIVIEYYPVNRTQSILDFTDCVFLFLVPYFITPISLQKKASRKQHVRITDSSNQSWDPVKLSSNDCQKVETGDGNGEDEQKGGGEEEEGGA